MPTLTAIAKRLGISQPRASQLVKEGMPTNTFAAAIKWKVGRLNKRAAVNSKAIESKQRGRPRKAKPALKSGDSLLDALHEAIERSEEAHRLAQDAMLGNRDELIASRISVANKASDQRLKTEVQYRQEMERRKTLIQLNDAQDMALRGFSKILNSLQRMPSQMSQRLVNQPAATIADILTIEVNAIIREAQKTFELQKS